jgi:hypothetical protein
MNLKTTYTLMPLEETRNPIMRNMEAKGWSTIPYPFNEFPPLECHASPPLVVINGGPKLDGLNLDVISSQFHAKENKKQEEKQEATKIRLALLRSIWVLILSARELAASWEASMGKKRKRDEYDEDHKEILDKTSIHYLTRSVTGKGTGKALQKANPTGTGVTDSVLPMENGGTYEPGWEAMDLGTLSGDVLAELGKNDSVETTNRITVFFT